ncbi:MAG TPA: SDR family oxidoreductase [Armatimonadota bacterium]|jgi:NAD(P)-dependent dehydrogenase (short-subunit alcohol dehydrogenase family)
MDRSGRVAVVTGGASGIGEATAREFALEGASVAIIDINAEAGQAAVAQLQSEGFTARFYEIDVSDHDACLRVADSVAADWGRIDYLVNCAASFLGKGLDVTTQDWERSLGVNVRGTANMAQACHPHMKRAGGGAIVNTSSISGHIAQPNRWTYNATKGAILAMTRCQALDLAPDGIRVNAVSPGWTWTPEVAKAAVGGREQWEPLWGRYSMLRRLGEAREIARAILFLCGDDASFITGTELPVDGGYLGLSAEGLGDTASFAGTA